MKVRVNGQERETNAATLAELVAELQLSDAVVATAHNRLFAPRDQRDQVRLADGDEVEILSPRQGG